MNYRFVIPPSIFEIICTIVYIFDTIILCTFQYQFTITFKRIPIASYIYKTLDSVIYGEKKLKC